MLSKRLARGDVAAMGLWGAYSVWWQRRVLGRLRWEVQMMMDDDDDDTPSLVCMCVQRALTMVTCIYDGVFLFCGC